MLSSTRKKIIRCESSSDEDEHISVNRINLENDTIVDLFDPENDERSFSIINRASVSDTCSKNSSQSSVKRSQRAAAVVAIQRLKDISNDAYFLSKQAERISPGYKRCFIQCILCA